MLYERFRAIVESYKNSSKYVKASVWFALCMFLQKGIGTITTPVFTRLMSTDEYGQFCVFSSWLGIATVFVTLNLYFGVFTSGLIRYEHDRDRFSSSMHGLLTFMVCVWGIVYCIGFEFWNELLSLSTEEMIMMFLLIWSASVFQLWGARQRALFNYKKLVVITLIVSVATSILGVCLVSIADDKVLARIVGMVAGSFFVYAWVFSSDVVRGKCVFSAYYWKYAIFMAVPLIPHYLSAVILVSADRIMIAKMISESAAGIYSLGYSVSQVMTIANTAILQALEPWIYKNIKDLKFGDIENIAYRAFVFIALLNVIFIAFAPEAVALFAPQDYYDAIWVIPPVVMSIYFTFLYGFFASYEFYFKKTYFISIATVIGAVVNIGLNYICLERFGYYAAGYTTLLCYIIFACMHYVFMNRVCHKYLSNFKPYNGKKIIAITSVFLIVGGVFLLTYENFLFRYGLITMLMVIIFYKRVAIKNNFHSILSIKKAGIN